jgi:putative ABC transport system permease protein
VRELVHTLDNNLPVTEIGTQSARAQTTLAQERLYARLFGFFGVVALALAGIGLFGVSMAFGARAVKVVVMVIWQGMKLVLIGLAVGSLVGFTFMRLLNSQYFGPDTWQQEMKQQLYGVTVSDPFTLIAVASLLTLVAFIACWLPACRAAKVDPLGALRHE